MSEELAQKTCIPCQGGVPALEAAEQEEFLEQISGWELVENHHLSKEFSFDGFPQAIAWVNRVADLSEEQAHHQGRGEQGLSVSLHSNSPYVGRGESG